MFHIFHFLQSDTVLATVNPFLELSNAIFSEKSCLISVPFLYAYTDNIRTVKFSRLLNPDWSIQISGAPAVCKDQATRQK